MSDFFTFMHSVNHKAESVAMDEKPVEKAEVECGLCMTEKDKKAGECKFDKGASKPVRDALMGYLEGEEETEEKPDGETEEESEVMVGEDAAPGGKFDEEKHPRESKGGEGGGRFKTSNKTIEEQDVVETPNKRSKFAVSPQEAEILDIIDRCDKKLSDEEVFKLRDRAESKTTTAKELEKLAFAERYTSANANCEIQEAVANNPNTPSKVLKHLTGFPSQNEDYHGKVYNTNGVALAAKRNLASRK